MCRSMPGNSAWNEATLGTSHLVANAGVVESVTDVFEAAVEYDEFGDHRLAASIERAEAEVDALAYRLQGSVPSAAPTA